MKAWSLHHFPPAWRHYKKSLPEEVAIRITGSVRHSLTTTILSRVPRCTPDAWFPEYALPERALLPAEQAWSNLMDPKAAAKAPGPNIE